MAGFGLWASGFRLSGCKGTIQYEQPSDGVKTRINVAPAPDTYIHYQLLLGAAGITTLTLPISVKHETAPRNEVVLKRGLGPRYRITFLQREAPFWAHYPFFIYDERRTMFVTQKTDPPGRPKVWAIPDRINLDARLGSIRALPNASPEEPASSSNVNVVTRPNRTSSSTRRATALPAPERLLALMPDRSGGSGAPVFSVAPPTARAVVEFRNEGSAPDVDSLRVATGSDGERTVTIGQTKIVPVVAPIEPLSLHIPLLRPVVDRYLFEPFYHPYTCDLIKQIARYGVDGLLDPPPGGIAGLRRQAKRRTFTKAEFDPTAYVAQPYPREEFDFSRGGAYSAYNWELFFHVPIHIALRLVADQRFEESFRWFHAVFHPMERPAGLITGAERVWKVKPFFGKAQPESIDDLLSVLTYGGDDEKLRAQQRDVEHQIADWRARPFEPHRIARIRISAYMRFAALKYVEALIAWGDQLFRRETLESINEATQLYVLALRILGRRPERVERQNTARPKSFRDLIDPKSESEIDAFSNALIKIESMLPESVIPARSSEEDGSAPALTSSFMFCIPPNHRVLGLWDVAEDRLFKIRHSMNIEGIARQLPLFEPPIDPALLVRARALGLDLSTVLDDISAPPPLRRFRVLVAKAQEMCSELKSLAASLLAALEKRDGEELARVRARHESDILELSRADRTRQIEEARETRAALEQSLASARKRQAHYTALLARGQLPQETLQQERLDTASEMQRIAQMLHAYASVVAVIPQTGFFGAFASAHFGGQHLHALYSGLGSAFGAEAGIAAAEAAAQGNRAVFVRRSEDWQLQADLAANDVAQIERQAVAQDIRIAMAEHELKLHERQVENARESEEFLRDKYTNKELYDWMVGQLSALYFQSYKLAFDIAKRAERAFQFERAEATRSFVKFGAWESMRKGLLAGERLSLDLRRMELAFLGEDKRSLELTRSISVGELDPEALLALRETGACEIVIPESFYDADSPGHYQRRLRTVALTIPSVAGPYVPVRCTLTLLSSQVRPAPNEPLTSSHVAVQCVVTSHAREDLGVFDNPMADERYAPFEGAGAVARFRLELPTAFRAFDYSTIGDVVLHVRYTARDGGRSLRATSSAAVATDLRTGSGWARAADSQLATMLSLKSDFPDVWAKLLSPATSSAVRFAIPITRERFPFAFAHRFSILGIDLIGVVDNGYPTSGLTVSVTSPVTESGALTASPPFAAYRRVSFSSTTDVTVDMSIDLAAHTSAVVVAPPVGPKRLNDAVVKDIVLVVRYKLA